MNSVKHTCLRQSTAAAACPVDDTCRRQPIQPSPR